MGRPCRFVLAGDRVQCPNCLFDRSSGVSAGIYNGSGPRAFARPPCPVCRGTGYDPATHERVEEGVLSISRNIKPDKVFGPGVVASTATIAAVKGTSDLIPLVQSARYIILDYANAKYTQEKFVLLDGTAPKLTGSIVAGRYFTAFLKQVE